MINAYVDANGNGTLRRRRAHGRRDRHDRCQRRLLARASRPASTSSCEVQQAELVPVLPGRHGDCGAPARRLGHHAHRRASVDSGNDFGNYQQRRRSRARSSTTSTATASRTRRARPRRLDDQRLRRHDGNGTRDAGENTIAGTATDRRERGLLDDASLPATTSCARCSRRTGSSPSRSGPTACGAGRRAARRSP